MKKFLFTILICLFSFNQVQAKKVFCELFFECDSNGKNADDIEILWGNKLSKTQKVVWAKDNSNVEFKSVIEALEIMSELGWEFVESYVTDGGEDMHFILQKEVKNDEEIMEGFLVVEKNKKK